jgi:integrase
MGTVVERVGRDGKTKSFQAKVRKKGVCLTETFAKESDAEDWITLTEAKIIKGESVDIHRVRKTLLKEIFQDYIENGKQSKNKIGTLKILIAEIGDVVLENFTTKKFGQYLDVKLDQQIKPQINKKKEHKLFNGGKVLVNGELVLRTYSASTIRKYYYAIRTALSWHAKINDYHFNSKPFDDNPAPGGWDNPRERRLEGNELERLLKATDKMYVNQQVLKDMICFQIYSCMRVGETLLMRWKDLKMNDVEPWGSFIFVPKEHQKTRNKKKSVFDREVSTREDLHKLIVNNILPRRGDAKDNDRVFPFWPSSNVFYQRFKVCCKNAEITDLHPHDLRHEGISFFYENTNLSDIQISKITGHTELDTLKLYAKLRPKNTGAKIWAGLSGVMPTVNASIK